MRWVALPLKCSNIIAKARSTSIPAHEKQQRLLRARSKCSRRHPHLASPGRKAAGTGRQATSLLALLAALASPAEQRLPKKRPLPAPSAARSVNAVPFASGTSQAVRTSWPAFTVERQGTPTKCWLGWKRTRPVPTALAESTHTRSGPLRFSCRADGASDDTLVQSGPEGAAVRPRTC